MALSARFDQRSREGFAPPSIPSVLTTLRLRMEGLALGRRFPVPPHPAKRGFWSRPGHAPLRNPVILDQDTDNDDDGGGRRGFERKMTV